VTARVVLVDSSVPLYALGAESRWREPCRRVLALIADGEWVGVASTEMIQEVVHHRLRLTGDRARAVADARDVAELHRLVPLDETVLEKALALVENDGVRGRDAVHAATALTQGIGAMVSTDPAFDAVPGLIRLDPATPADDHEGIQRADRGAIARRP